MSTNRFFGASIAAIVVAAIPSAAYAQQTYSFDVPAEKLADSLRAIGARSGTSIAFDPALTKGKKAPAIKGVMGVNQALTTALSGSGLEARTSASGYIVAAHAADLGNEAAGGPNAGNKNSTSSLGDESATESARQQAIVVTGSNIRGIGTPTAPVTVIDRQAIDRSGYNDTQQLVRSLPQNFGGGSLGATEDGRIGPGSHAGENVGAATGLNLRGLGNDSTLVLLNGNRIAPSDVGRTVDVSLIPLAAIDRVEIVTDGSSAVYGADAVGGVVNFVLRKDYDGAESNVRFGTVTDGSLAQATVNLAIGRAWNSGGLLISGQYQEQTPLSSDERTFTSTVVRPTYIFPKYRTDSGLISGHQELAPGVTASVDALLSRKSVFNQISTKTTGQSYENVHDQENVTPRLSVDGPGDWRFDGSATYTRSHDQETFSRLIPSVKGVVLGDVASTTTDQMLLEDFKGNGSLFEIPGGKVKFAFGASQSTEKFHLLTLTKATNTFHRNVTSEYGETYVPLISPNLKIPFANELVLSAAIRHDNYSDFGGTTNERLGALWSPFADVHLRGSYSTSYRAPNASEEATASGTSAGARITSFLFPSPTGVGTVPTFVLTGNDPNLKPETAKTWSGGAEYRPHFVSGLRLSVDYYHIRFINRIAQPPFDAGALQHPDVYGSLITPLADDAAAAAFLANAIASGRTFVDFAGTGATGVRFVFNDQTQNEAQVLQSGYDLAAGYHTDIGRNSLDAHVNAAIINEIDVALAPSATSKDHVNTYSNPLHFRARGDLTWSFPSLEATAAVNYANAYTDTSASPAGRVHSLTTVDFDLRYHPIGLARWMNGFTFELSVINLFDAAPPLVHGTGSGVLYDVGNADPLGRFVTFGIRKTW